MLNMLFYQIPTQLWFFHWQHKLKILLLQFLAAEIIVIFETKIYKRRGLIKTSICPLIEIYGNQNINF